MATTWGPEEASFKFFTVSGRNCALVIHWLHLPVDEPININPRSNSISLERNFTFNPPILWPSFWNRWPASFHLHTTVLHLSSSQMVKRSQLTWLCPPSRPVPLGPITARLTKSDFRFFKKKKKKNFHHFMAGNIFVWWRWHRHTKTKFEPATPRRFHLRPASSCGSFQAATTFT